MTVRKIRVEGDIAYVPLTRGKEAIIDVADIPIAEGRNWHVRKDGQTFYAARSASKANGNKPGVIILHRVITGVAKHLQVDHIDGDGLNNRRSNLRLSTQAENTRNAKRRSDNASGFKGVSWRKDISKWRADIAFNKKQINLGYFDCPKEAHAAYCAASEKYHGEFGRAE